MGIHHDAGRCLRRPVQAIAVRRPHLDPGLQDARQVPHDDRRLIRIGQPLGECDAFGVLETVGKQACQKVFGSLGTDVALCGSSATR